MRVVKVARVAVEQTTLGFDKLFDYLIPFDMAKYSSVGARVIVPFGRGNRKKQGVIMEIIEVEESTISVIKPIHEILDKNPILNNEMINLAFYMKDRFFCTYYDAIRPMLPAGINHKIIATYQVNTSSSRPPYEKLPVEVREVLTQLEQNDTKVKHQRLLEILELPSDSNYLNKLVEQKYLIRTDEAIRRVGDATVKMVSLNTRVEELESDKIKLTPKQKSVFELLSQSGSASIKEVCYFTGVSQAVVSNMIKKNYLVCFDNEVYRSQNQYASPKDTKEIVLSDEQNAAYQGLLSDLKSDKGEISLLYGVTGSGKTQVFLKLIDEVIKEGKGVIVMVPEIALTPQTLSIFQNRYGSNVAIFHSAMSLGQRMDEWKRVKNGDAKIAIGTRSAIFAPFDNLGLIVMDEEQEHTYKSESSPRYHAADIAKFRAKYHKGLFLMASATPSVETYCKAKEGIYKLYTLKNRYGNASLPEVNLVNMRCELADGNFSPISRAMKDAVEDALLDEKQAIILLNRRGHHVFVSCRNCGEVKSCPNCSISLTYHSANGRLLCHYCGYSEPFSDTCDKCGEKQIKSSGYGTQKIEEELKELFEDAKILRMDADTTMTRSSHERLLNSFQKGDYDILLGTQMVAKGLDFPKVTLVGVLNADGSMHSVDYKSSERTFSLLTQVVGRSGRGDDHGIAIIQSMTPEAEIVKLSSEQDYDAFYNTEILSRKLLTYPPFCDICVVGFSGFNKDLTFEAAKSYFNILSQSVNGEYKDLKMIVLGPSAGTLPKVNNKYRFKLIIKCRNTKRQRDLILNILKEVENNKKFRNISIFADMNPEKII